MRTYLTAIVGILAVGLALGGSGGKTFAQAPPAAKAAEAAPIKIGAIFAVTGPASFLGAPEAKTLEMLVEKINAAGGINGQKIELIIKDSGSKPEKAVSFAKQLIEEEKVLAIIGPSTSGETMAIKNTLPGGQDDPALLRRGRDHRQPGGQVRLQDAPEGQRRGAVGSSQTMKEKGITKIGVICQQHGLRQGRQGAAGEARRRVRHHDRHHRGLRQAGDRPDRRGDQGEGARTSRRSSTGPSCRRRPSWPRT